jgi:hypothetical protein
VADDEKTEFMIRNPATGEWDRLVGMESTKVPAPANRTDDAWNELQQLRARAAELGIAVDLAWPVMRLREEIAKAGGA